MRIHKTERFCVVDTRLNELAALVADMAFGLDAAEIEHYDFLHREGELQNVTLCRDGRLFRVRFSLGGKQRTIGLHAKGSSAAIYADCAKLFFWPFRLRDALPPTDADFNFSLARAQEMLASHESLGSHLDAIHKHLASFGDLREVNHSDEDLRKQRKKLRESRRTVKSELRELLASQMAEIILSRAESQENYEQIKAAFHHILERLDKLDAGQTTSAPVNKANTNA